MDIGGHHIQALAYLGCVSGWFASLYKYKNLKFEGTAVYTNKVPACALQGYGNPDINFAIESTVDILAEKLGMDPIQFRLMNYRGIGDEFWGQGADHPLDHQKLRCGGIPGQGGGFFPLAG